MDQCWPISSKSKITGSNLFLDLLNAWIKAPKRLYRTYICLKGEKRLDYKSIERLKFIQQAHDLCFKVSLAELKEEKQRHKNNIILMIYIQYNANVENVQPLVNLFSKICF